jgi:predicted outer membrane repeat protein
VQVDLIAPVVKITAPLDGLVTNKGSVEVSWTLDDKVQASYTQILIEGETEISKTVTDSAGNTGSKAITVTKRSQVVFVNASAAAGGDGNSWLTAYRSLQDGLAKSRSGWEVWVAKGAYAPNAGMPPGVDTSFVMTTGAALLGGFAGTETIKTARDWKTNETIISGDPALTGQPANLRYRPLLLGAEEGRLDGFIVEKGSSGKGSGMSASVFASITITNCVFRNHEGTAEEGGGAIQSYGANITISNSEFISNSNSGEGGAICLLGANATISNCKFIGNRSTRSGGGLYVDSDASVTISNSIFQGNVSQTSGGAIAHRGRIEIKSSYLLENSSGRDGGAIYSQLDYLTLLNCVIANNSAEQTGGGLYVFFSNLSGTNLTIYGNASKDDGGAFYFAGSEFSPSSVRLQNSILWGNRSLTSGNQIALNPAIFGNASFTLEYSDLEGGIAGVSKPDSADWTTGPGVISSDPSFRDPLNLAGPDGLLMTSDDGLSLKGGSAVNAGWLFNAPSTDITGSIRPKGGYVDLGAYEP